MNVTNLVVICFPKKQHIFLIAFAASVFSYFVVIGPVHKVTGLPSLPLMPLYLFFLSAFIAEGLFGSFFTWVAASIFFVAGYFLACLYLCRPLIKQELCAKDFAWKLYFWLLGLNGLYLLVAAPQGMRLYGPEIPRQVALLDFAAAIFCGILLMLWQWQPRYSGLSIASYGALLFWLSWFSFPYLGEMM
jgi:hypothetical protein